MYQPTTHLGAVQQHSLHEPVPVEAGIGPHVEGYLEQGCAGHVVVLLGVGDVHGVREVQALVTEH